MKRFLISITFTIAIMFLGIMTKGNIGFFAVTNAFGAEAIPANIATDFSLGISLLEQKKYDEAIAISRKIIQMKPDFVPAYDLLGSSLAAKGNNENSITVLKEALIVLKKYQSLGGPDPGLPRLIGLVENSIKEISAAQNAISPTTLTDKITWNTWEEGRSIARKSHKPIFLLIYTDRCPRCAELKNSFTNDELIRISKRFVMIKQNQDEHPAWLNKAFGQFGGYVPRVFFLRADGTMLSEIKSAHPRYPYFYPDLNNLKQSMKKASQEKG